MRMLQDFGSHFAALSTLKYFELAVAIASAVIFITLARRLAPKE